MSEVRPSNQRVTAIQLVIARIEEWQNEDGRLTDRTWDLMGDAARELSWLLEEPSPVETSEPLTHSPEPSAYLKLWDQNGPRCRVDLTPINEPWLEALKPIVTPLYARMPSVEPTPCPACVAVRKLGLLACQKHPPEKASGEQCSDPEHSDFQRQAPWNAFGEF